MSSIEDAPARRGKAIERTGESVPSWIVGLCGVAAVASVLFSILLFLNR
jgi:hypothetical protein